MAIKQPADKSYFILPDLGEGVHEAELIRWRVKPGDEVEEHQTLAEMETDKALVEVPSPWAGTISELHGEEGEILNVGNKLVSYASSVAGPAAELTAAVVGAANANAEREDAGTVVGSVSGELTVSDRFTRRRPDEHATPARRKALATPAVRRIARELGIDINRVPGTGRGGRVTASDVQSFAGGVTTVATPMAAPAAEMPAAAVAAVAPVAITGDGVAQRIPFRGVRRTIAQALDQSVKTAVHFTVVDEADITQLAQKRAEYTVVLGRKLSILPFVMTAVCRALRLHPSINANVDDANAEILVRSVINLGCAVDTDHGLMVPVIVGADALSIVQLADSVKQAAVACRNRTIALEQLTGGTFTISNVGSYGGLFATPIINYPEVAILAVGRSVERVLTQDGRFYAGRILPLSLSCDHRVVDGAEGARFLDTVRRLLEEPERLLQQQ
ncbi:MAG: dihydrolipoamide acetyltransferase family protein [Planctomycetota bacterium]|jgi:pyruvate dehydrogenase E2 component (dihydrolipoamide acetyltransferase)